MRRDAAGRASGSRRPEDWPGLYVHGRVPRCPVTATPAIELVDSGADRSVSCAREALALLEKNRVDVLLGT
jgi:hypothetical protein